ncbi:hypothetical protein [Amycolatopsis nigrescens]|uniref:hypothetical protein n=1 Tax=Amycolatopsis nigrescens TaxID=381445 RepID=UPI000380BF2C|nr:hypothetical protein [Amycolatopsis nigrescens]
MTVDGTWNLTIATPIGRHDVVLELSTKDGVLQGSAENGPERVVLNNPVLKGNRLTWSQVVTKPAKLTLKFDVTVDGDSMTGSSKAGLLPGSKVVGQRVSA